MKLTLGNGQVIAIAECIGTAPEFKCDVQTTDGDEAILSIDLSWDGSSDSVRWVRLSESDNRCRTCAAALAR